MEAMQMNQNNHMMTKVDKNRIFNKCNQNYYV